MIITEETDQRYLLGRSVFNNYKQQLLRDGDFHLKYKTVQIHTRSSVKLQDLYFFICY
jgi:hypothetical protein